ncbi:MAG: Rha family transcriptional regulator [Oscillospiraceae bacterium]|nr:Rha family transcriptional regulator [Oscillospiraceae bacterium]
MNELAIMNFNGIETVDSRQVADVIGKAHKNLLQDIRTYCGYLNELNFQLVDFFIESDYIDSKGEERPCYLITRKGCEMIANKLTGKKGTEFTAKYINAFHTMEQRLKEQTQAVPIVQEEKGLDVNTRIKMSNQLLKLAMVDNLPEEYKNILVAKSAEILTGQQLIPLPQVTQKMYTATEVGKMYGVSAQRIGKISNQYNLKTPEYGAWYKDKARYSDKEVDTFKYNDEGVAKFGELLKN